MPYLRRRGWPWLGAMCVLGCLTSTFAGAEIERPLGWWQFEPRSNSDALEDSNREEDFETLSIPGGYVDSPLGIARAARFTPASFFALRLADSSDGSHWSKVPASGVIQGFAAFRFLDAPGTIIGTWSSDATSSWRLVVAEDLGLRLDVVNDIGVVSAVQTSPVLVVDQTHFAFWTIDETTTTATVRVLSDAGIELSAASGSFSGTVRDSSSNLIAGRHGASSTSSAGVELDLLAFWDTELDEASRAALVDNGQGRRYADLFVDPLGAADPAYKIERIATAFSGDKRHVLLGDSFVNNASFGRVSTALLKVAPWSDLNAVTIGVSASSSTLVTTTTVALGPDNPRTIGNANTYGCEYLGGASATDSFGLPVRDGGELWAHAGASVPTDGLVWTTTLRNSLLADGATPRITEAGDVLRIRPIHRAASVPTLQFPSYRLTDAPGSTSVIGSWTGGSPRQAARGSAELVLTTGLDGDPTWRLGEAKPGDLVNAGGQLLDLLGFTCYTSTAGQHWSYLGHDSWTYANHGDDTESTGNKRYSIEQMTHWLDATSVNDDAEHIFWIHCDVEDRSEAEMSDALTALRDKVDAACTGAGIATWKLILLVPYMHNRGSLSVDGMRQANVDLRNAGRALADADERVCVFSIYDATNGTFFDGSTEAITWLLDHGYDSFTYGSTTADLVNDSGGLLLDVFLSHPVGPDASAFFISLASEAIVSICPPDLDQDQIVGFSDILLLLGSWGPCSRCSADLDQDGIVGFTDLLVVLNGWGPCRER